MTVDWRPTVEQPDDDPYIWLEEIAGARACAWADTESAKTLARFASPDFHRDCRELAALLDRPDKLPIISRRDAFVYNFWQDARNPRGLWRRTTLAEFRVATPTWDILLDVDQLAVTEQEDWVWQGASTLPPAHERAMLRLSRGGSDAVVLREFDLAARAFVDGGFRLPEAKGGAEWWDKDTLIVSSAVGGDTFVTSSGYARTVRAWRRGTDITSAPVIFDVPATSMGVWASVERGAEPVVWFVERPAFFDAYYHVGDASGAQARLHLPSHASIDTHRDWMSVQLRKAWTVAGQTFQPDMLLVISLKRFLAGARDFKVLYAPGERRSLQSWCWVDGRLVLSILDELKPRFEVYDGAANWQRIDLPGVPTEGVVSVWRLDVEDEESNGDLLMTSEDPLTPPTLSLIESGLVPAVLRQSSRTFDATGLAVTQHEAISVDGERIPYTQVGPAAQTGDAPVHVTGYGGFRAPSRPVYATAVGKLWLERGGTHVIANIRGGGEFGTRWHESAIREKKPRSHDDFASVAADLVRRGVTLPGRIAAEGGSNGGILISNMLTRYPDRFGALFCTIPLIDMRRYSKLLAGASWMAEYGDPDKPEDWAFLQTYSAYHQVKAGQAYPPILIATTRKDDRVHPGHARKFAAKLQAMGYVGTAYFENPTGGHGYGKDSAERALFVTLGLRFLAESIGWRVS